MICKIHARVISIASSTKGLLAALLCVAALSNKAFGGEVSESTVETAHAATEVLQEAHQSVESAGNKHSVFIQAIVAIVSWEDAADLRISWDSGAGEAQADYVDQAENPNLIIGSIGNNDLGTVQRKLSAESDSKLIFTPTIYTLDGEEASIIIGSEVPLESSQSQGACLPNSSVVSSGLTINPSIDNEMQILLDVALEVSTVVPFDATGVQVAKNSCPPISTEYIRSSVKRSGGEIAVLSRPTKSDRDSSRLMLFLKPSIGNAKNKLMGQQELTKLDNITIMAD